MNNHLSFFSLLFPFLVSFLLSIPITFYEVNPITQLSLGYVAGNYAFDILSYLVTVIGSSWFMIIFGSWLSVLVIDKILHTRNRGNKFRLLLMFIAYWVYSIYLPSFSPASSYFPNIPYSWFNGIGTFGPVAPSLFLGLIGTYVVTAILSFMFGSRQICSVTCTAPYMLQGTGVNDMKIYNRKAKLGRRTLTSKLSPWFKVIGSLTWAVLLAFALISFLNSIHITNITFFGNDPTVFFATFYFNFIWYLQFLGSPYFGNYACVNHGICPWGTYNQFFGY
ncbi:4Fe-4S ferredoxin, partial [Acidianus sp. DSM 29099]|nr:4Fe-4S ferredoxin [Acidianus sp. RZ1]